MASSGVSSADPSVLEPIASRAWPAAEQAAIGGWRLHASSGFSGRINSCWPLAAPDRPLEQALNDTEAWYAARDLRCVFKIVEAAAHPPDLAAALQARGYRPYTPTLMMVGPAEGEADPGVLVEDRPGEEFERVFVAAGDGNLADARERLAALARMAPPRGFARIEVDGETVAIGAFSAEGPWTGIFAMRTDARRRREGFARRVFASLLAASRKAGARRAYLQVEAANAPAVALYAAAGFTEAYRYRYWSREAARA